MKKLAAAAVALLLSGCASMPAPRPQAHVVPSYTKSAKVVQPDTPAIATPLKSPKWYDKFRQHNGRWFH